MTESTMRKELKTEFKKLGIKLIPIETGGTALGIPDCYYYGRYNDHFISGWIELKTEWKFQPGQKKFIGNMNSLGGTAWILYFNDKCYYVYKNHYNFNEINYYNASYYLNQIVDLICKESVNI